jgi:hypothetical protein
MTQRFLSSRDIYPAGQEIQCIQLEGVSLSLLKPAIGPYPEPAQSNSHLQNAFVHNTVLILSSHLGLCLLNGLFYEMAQLK